ncbi:MULTISPECIES: lipopolysaccharide biosynthesis protein [unclassified Cryobacterium]|uniref:lipopolysaccharide biosynthesis protein n=1 Tax=unclassified Cryobacterium TaxID=2649013 RepID=UPI000CE2BEA5|nr:MULTISPECIES: lipopolysaccharide biosynthesis protein [unclassified Cryobacterium]
MVKTAPGQRGPQLRDRRPDGLGARAMRGATVVLGGQAGKAIIQLASVVVLARLLSPSDYGLIAMVITVVGVGELLRDFGLSSAAIQAPSLSREQRDNLWWVNVGLGIALAGLVCAGSDVLAAAYGQSSIGPIAQALSLTFVINGCATQYRADLVRQLRFVRISAIDVVAPAVALTLAIGAALLGWHYWAIVVQQLAQAGVTLILLVLSARWIPGRPRRDAPIGGFLHYGWNMVAAQLVGYLSNNVDNLLIGLRFGPVALGTYSRAFQLLMTGVNQVRLPLTTVALPILSRLSDDTVRFGDWLCRGQLMLGYTLVAALAVVASAAEPITAVFLGPQWAAAAPILRLLAIAGIFQSLAFVGYWVYLSRALTADLFRFSLLGAFIKITCVVVGSTGGVVGIALGYAIAPAIEWPISLWWLSRRTSIPTRQLFGGASRVLAIASIATPIAWFVVEWGSSWPAVPQVLAAFITVVATYALAGLLVPRIRRDLAGVIDAMRLVRGRGESA